MNTYYNKKLMFIVQKLCDEYKAKDFRIEHKYVCYYIYILHPNIQKWLRVNIWEEDLKKHLTSKIIDSKITIINKQIKNYQEYSL